jgi:cytoskeletal protein CcmA (bactofilin family)
LLRDKLKPTRPASRPSTADAPDPAAGAGSRTVLGPGSRFAGTLKTEGDVTLADMFEGNISARGEIRVGVNATLDGDLCCQSALIAGLVRGDVTAKVINITGTGRILGNLHAERLLTEDGSFIEGTITLDYEVHPFGKPPEPPPAPDAPDAAIEP